MTAILNVVFVKHGGSKEYCFEVPNDLVPYIKSGTTVLVNTKRGLDVGEATTGVISGPGARDVAKKNGAYFPLAKVISFLSDEFRKVCRNEIVQTIQGECLPNLFIPF